MDDEKPCGLLVQIAVSGMQSIKFGIGIAFVNRVLSLFKVTFQEDAPEIVVRKEPSVYCPPVKIYTPCLPAGSAAHMTATAAQAFVRLLFVKKYHRYTLCRLYHIYVT